MTMVWKTIKNYNNYEISTNGNIRNKITGRILKPLKHNRGYLSVSLYNNFHQKKQFLIHRLVLETFIPNHENKPEVNHIDCNKCNNKLENLEWCTRSENNQHLYDNNLKPKAEKHHNGKLTNLDIKFIKYWLDHYYTQRSIAKAFKISQSHIWKIKYGLRRSDINYE